MECMKDANFALWRASCEQRQEHMTHALSCFTLTTLEFVLSISLNISLRD